MISTLITVRLRMDTPAGSPPRKPFPMWTTFCRFAGTPRGVLTCRAPRSRAACARTAPPTRSCGRRKRCSVWPTKPNASPPASRCWAPGISVMRTASCGTAPPSTGNAARRPTPCCTESPVLPAGTEFDIVLRWDNPDRREEPFLRALQQWRPRLGRGASHDAGPLHRRRTRTPQLRPDHGRGPARLAASTVSRRLPRARAACGTAAPTRTRLRHRIRDRRRSAHQRRGTFGPRKLRRTPRQPGSAE